MAERNKFANFQRLSNFSRAVAQEASLIVRFDCWWGKKFEPIDVSHLRWNGREEERRRYEEERRREREREINLYGNIERNNPYREGG